MKVFERNEARRLRREGESIKAIASVVRASPSSVSRWVRDIELPDAHRQALRMRNPALNGQLAGVRARADGARRKRLEAQRDGRRTAQRRESLHAAGCMLFWAEGSRSRNTVRFTNSDPQMMQFFVAFLRAYFDVSPRQMRVWCNLHADHAVRQRDVEEFWLRTLGLPRECLTTSTVNRRSRASSAKRTNTLPYGTCRLSVHSTAVVQHLYGAIQEYGSFTRAAWLDC